MTVMPGHSSLPGADCVNLSALPGIHALPVLDNKDVDGRTWANGSEAVRRTAMAGHDKADEGEGA